MLTDEQIAGLMRPLYLSDTAAEMGLPDDIAAARLIEAATLKAHQQAIEAAVLAEREQCAQICEKFKEVVLASQSGGPDVLSNVMLRQVAVLGHSACADAIRSRTKEALGEAVDGVGPGVSPAPRRRGGDAAGACN